MEEVSFLNQARLELLSIIKINFHSSQDDSQYVSLTKNAKGNRF
jgi:hypothetical protein